VTSDQLALRPYARADEDAAIALWRRTWQQAYPDIDFGARLDWWRARWRGELVPACAITVAMAGEAMAGFVTVDPRTGYLDQLAESVMVTPWCSSYLSLSPRRALTPAACKHPRRARPPVPPI
jgi:hypothetical protein